MPGKKVDPVMPREQDKGGYRAWGPAGRWRWATRLPALPSPCRNRTRLFIALSANSPKEERARYRGNYRLCLHLGFGNLQRFQAAHHVLCVCYSFGPAGFCLFVTLYPKLSGLKIIHLKSQGHTAPLCLLQIHILDDRHLRCATYRDTEACSLFPSFEEFAQIETWGVNT